MKTIILGLFLFCTAAWAGLESRPVIPFGTQAKVISPGGLTSPSVLLPGGDVQTQLNGKQFMGNYLTPYLNIDFPYPTPGAYAGTVRTAATEAALVSAMAASSDGDVINLTADITLTSTLTVNKGVKIDGAHTINTAGTGGDPVVMIDITADNVYITNNITLRHLKTTNTSVEAVFTVNALNFVSNADVRFMNIGYTLHEASWSIGGKTQYIGALDGSTHFHFIIYRVHYPSQINGVEFWTSGETPVHDKFIYLSAVDGDDTFESILNIANCKQHDLTKPLSQFYIQDFFQRTVGAPNGLIVDGNSFNDQNGGIGFYSGETYGPFDFFTFVKIINNYEYPVHPAGPGDAYKGMVFADGYAALTTIGDTVLFYSNNTHPRPPASDFNSGFVSALDEGGIGYNSAQYVAPLQDGLGIKLNTVVPQPTCDVSHRGLMWLIEGATGVADIFQICQKTVADTYVWTTH